MNEYPVVWSDSLDPKEIWAGGCTPTTRGLRLRGSNGYDQLELALGRDDVTSVRRATPRERIAGFPSLRLETKTGRAFLIAGVMGVGLMTELLDALSSLG